MPKKNEESRWQRRPPVSGMSIEEMQQRVADGLAKRRQLGELQPLTSRALKTQPSGPTLTKKHRRVLIAATDLAIYALANNERENYCGACEAINAVRRQCELPTTFMQAMLEGVGEQAAALMGEEFKTVDLIARLWLAEYFTPSGKLISITKGKENGNGKSH